MLTSAECLQRFGDPMNDRERLAFEREWMTLWVPPPGISAFPRRVYCHRYLVPVLHDLHDRIIDNKLAEQVKTWDGCYNVRLKKGGTTLSLHAWGLAWDMNAAWNQFGQVPTMSPSLVSCIELSGADWGGRWKKPDGMHGQLATWPSNGA